MEKPQLTAAVTVEPVVVFEAAAPLPQRRLRFSFSEHTHESADLHFLGAQNDGIRSEVTSDLHHGLRHCIHYISFHSHKFTTPTL